MKKLNSILLIDDNEHDNFFHEIVLSDLNAANQIRTIQKATQALAYLTELHQSNQGFPELIFLDINMPEMSGFDFLEEYKKLNAKPKNKTSIVILSTSINDKDQYRALGFKEVLMFETKPLDKEKLEHIYNQVTPI